MQQNSFTITLDSDQQDRLVGHIQTGNYQPVDVPHAVIAADIPNCRIALFKSGKCLVQGKAAREWVTFTLEPLILKEARLGYESVVDPESVSEHMGGDESGKGDFFGPMVIAAAYVNRERVEQLRRMNVRDSKSITSDKRAWDLADEIQKQLKDQYAVVTIGPRAYNRLYASMRNVNRILAWGHARAIENLLEKVPHCPRAVSDQFGPKRQIEQALMKHGRHIELVQRPKAESDPAVAAASVLARAAFTKALKRLGEQYALTLPKGASEKVREAAGELIARHGPETLVDTAKCHFRTTDLVLKAAGADRRVLGPEGQAVSKPSTRSPASPAGNAPVRNEAGRRNLGNEGSA